jgi:hypothetical protein
LPDGKVLECGVSPSVDDDYLGIDFDEKPQGELVFHETDTVFKDRYFDFVVVRTRSGGRVLLKEMKRMAKIGVYIIEPELSTFIPC